LLAHAFENMLNVCPFGYSVLYGGNIAANHNGSILTNTGSKAIMGGYLGNIPPMSQVALPIFIASVSYGFSVLGQADDVGITVQETGNGFDIGGPLG
jgi:hypothetical protein